MAWVFSKRCKESLRAARLKVSIPRHVRYRIWMILEKFDESWQETTDTGFNYWNSSLKELAENIKAEHGLKALLAFPEGKEGSPVPSDLKGFVLRGNYPPYLFDALELFYEHITPNSQSNFQKRFNQIMEESDLPWRMAEGKIFPVNSHYIEETILRKSQELLKTVKFEGALLEFEKARIDLINGDYHGAIQNANLAVESVCKSILNVNKIRPGELYRRLIDSGLIPEYYEGFLKVFEENILRCVAIMRNEELGAGHGQGIQVNEIPQELAELGVHLAGVMIHYLIKRHITRTDTPIENEYEIIDEKEIPF